jgi:hypothetical protein
MVELRHGFGFCFGEMGEWFWAGMVRFCCLQAMAKARVGFMVLQRKYA